MLYYVDIPLTDLLSYKYSRSEDDREDDREDDNLNYADEETFDIIHNYNMGSTTARRVIDDDEDSEQIQSKGMGSNTARRVIDDDEESEKIHQSKEGDFHVKLSNGDDDDEESEKIHQSKEGDFRVKLSNVDEADSAVRRSTAIIDENSLENWKEPVTIDIGGRGAGVGQHLQPKEAVRVRKIDPRPLGILKCVGDSMDPIGQLLGIIILYFH